MTKAIALLSGGLDSTLAVRMMLDQGIEVHALNLVTPFCTCTRKGCRHQASLVADELGIPVRVINGGDDYLAMVQNPRHGYGKNMNPCIDCRIFTFTKAKEYMHELGADFMFTGEVLGQRPMSQRKAAMALIEKDAGVEGLVLRPLSAHLMSPTIPETEGQVDRERLLAIHGRSRKPQQELAEHYGMLDYLCPAGGCRLTDPQFAKRLREAFDHGEASIADVVLLRFGRHFRAPSGAKVVVGRNEEENERLRDLARDTDLLLEVVGVGSPTTLLRNSASEADVEFAARQCARYADCPGGVQAEVEVLGNGSEPRQIAIVAPTV